jgi:hypothetical protein
MRVETIAPTAFSPQMRLRIRSRQSKIKNDLGQLVAGCMPFRCPSSALHWCSSIRQPREPRATSSFCCIGPTSTWWAITAGGNVHYACRWLRTWGRSGVPSSRRRRPLHIRVQVLRIPASGHHQRLLDRCVVSEWGGLGPGAGSVLLGWLNGPTAVGMIAVV